MWVLKPHALLMQDHCRFCKHSAMSKLEKAIVALVEVFEEYAGKDANKKSLSNAELSALIKGQLSCPSFQGKVEQAAVREALDKMDKNRDGQVSFKEFCQSMVVLAEGYYQKKQGQVKCK